jgi:hypothetical protein
LTVASGTPVLVVENPRLMEAAADHRLAAAVLCTNGNPTTAPGLAITQLWSCGARMRYHGDFDAAGLALAGRARDAGCQPFRMSAPDYYDALAQAAAAGVELPRDPASAPPTPWGPRPWPARSTNTAPSFMRSGSWTMSSPPTRPTVEGRASNRRGGQRATGAFLAPTALVRQSSYFAMGTHRRGGPRDSTATGAEQIRTGAARAVQTGSMVAAHGQPHTRDVWVCSVSPLGHRRRPRGR